MIGAAAGGAAASSATGTPPTPGSETVALENHNVSGFTEFPSTMTVVLRVRRDGVLLTGIGTGGNINYVPEPDEWVDTQTIGIGDGYEVQLTTVSGTLSNGTADSWLALSTDRDFMVEQLTSGHKSFSGTLKIRETGMGPETTSDITLSATVLPDIPA